DQWMRNYKSWQNFVMLAYDERMKELIQTIDQITFNQLDQRLLEYLNKRAALHPERIVQATHQEIATDMHASREAVSRLLKKLEKQDRLTLERNQIILR
ncbi:MAG: helix-turn-helix domain-containing protein, partial [Bacteroidota bacterium]